MVVYLRSMLIVVAAQALLAVWVPKHAGAEFSRFDLCWRPGAFSFYGREGPYRCEMAHAFSVDLPRWAAWLRRGAEAGFPAMQRELAWELYRGRYMRKDWVGAAHWLLSAARAEDRAAQSMAGKFFYWGVVLAHDPAKARLWTRRAADNGHLYSMFTISTYYRHGVGGAVDKPLADHFLRVARSAYREREAKRLTDGERLFRMGIWHLCPPGAPQDVELAHRFLQEAAARKHAAATTLLGRNLAQLSTRSQCRKWPGLRE